MRHTLTAITAKITATILIVLMLPSPSAAFCGFFVAKADTELFNQASKVVIVRDGDRTVLTMANDYRGEPREFALVVPVPTFLEREQIHVSERGIIDQRPQSGRVARHDDFTAAFDGGEQLERVLDHGASVQRKELLGRGAVHARTAACGGDANGEFSHWSVLKRDRRRTRLRPRYRWAARHADFSASEVRTSLPSPDPLSPRRAEYR